MRDPLGWSFPIGRLFGIGLKIHWLFPVIALAIIIRTGTLKDAPSAIWLQATVIVGLLFFAVLLHELGHCFGARLVDGDAHEVLLWPLGGLAYVDVPHTAKANFIATAAGPAVNLILCLLVGGALGAIGVQPPFNPLWPPIGSFDHVEFPPLYYWDGSQVTEFNVWIVLAARFFWVNYLLMLINVVLIGFPLDGGRMFQCALWPRLGYHQATVAAIYAGFICVFALFIVAFVVNEIAPFALGVFIFISCKQQWILLETGGEDSMLGYDFSQGYTSLEREQPAAPRRKRQTWWQRWKQQRATRKMLRAQEQREFEERRMDELLEKVQQQGLAALSDEERRFLKRVSDKYRNRH
jgi:Zn-dependent protease